MIKFKHNKDNQDFKPTVIKSSSFNKIDSDNVQYRISIDLSESEFIKLKALAEISRLDLSQTLKQIVLDRIL